MFFKRLTKKIIKTVELLVDGLQLSQGHSFYEGNSLPQKTETPLFWHPSPLPLASPHPPPSPLEKLNLPGVDIAFERGYSKNVSLFIC